MSRRWAIFELRSFVGQVVDATSPPELVELVS